MAAEIVDVVTSADGERYEIVHVQEDALVKEHAYVRRDGVRQGSSETVAAARKLAQRLAEGQDAAT